jgi:hypothetical protein
LKNHERRPLLAAVCNLHFKKTVERVLEIPITDREWKMIKVHSIHPSPHVQASKKKWSRNRVSQTVLRNLLAFLESPGNVQRYAFGQQVVELFNGASVAELDAVERCKKLENLAAEFIVSISAEMDAMVLADTQMISALPKSEERCQRLERGTLRRCMQKRGHCDKCKFTPKGSISIRTAMKLVSGLTSGEMKRLSGLDDTKVIKGRDNFIRLRKLAQNYCVPGEDKEMIERIDKTETFCQTDLIPHFERVSECSCCCLTCGFFDKGQCIVG